MKTVWDTQLILQSERAEFWRSAVCEAFLSMTPHIDCATNFNARLDHQSIDGIDLNRIVAPAHGVSRSKSDIARSSKDVFFVNMCTTGRCRVTQSGRAYTANAQELILIDSTTPYTVSLPDGGELFSISLPSQRLVQLAPKAHDLTATQLPSSTATRLLRSQIHQVAAVDDISPGQSSLVGQLFILLTAGCLGEVEDAKFTESPRLRRLRKLMACCYQDQNYSPAKAAQQGGMSLRTMHAEFGRVNSTFSSELYEVRLNRARDLLLLSAEHINVSTVSLKCGFKNAEHFSKKFRERFGVAPSRFGAVD